MIRTLIGPSQRSDSMATKGTLIPTMRACNATANENGSTRPPARSLLIGIRNSPKLCRVP